MEQNMIGRLSEVVALVERAAPFIEVTDAATGRETLDAMRADQVRFARVVRTEDDMVRSALLSADDLRRFDPVGRRRLADGFDQFPDEVMLDWLDLLGDAAREALAEHPDARLVSVEDGGETLGVLPVEMIAAVEPAGSRV
jgi:hypothetical protein